MQELFIGQAPSFPPLLPSLLSLLVIAQLVLRGLNAGREKGFQIPKLVLRKPFVREGEKNVVVQ